MSKASYPGLRLGLMALMVVCLGATGCQEQLADATVANQAARTLMIQNVDFYNSGNLSMVDMIISPDYVGHYSSVAEDVIGREGLIDWVKLNRTAFSDFNVNIDKIIVEGDMVCLQWTVTGTHDGPLRDLPPTGKGVNVEGISVARVVDGKIVEEWITWDMLSMYRQLGFTVTPPRI